MSAHLITLQDHDIAIRSPEEVVARSPGFASFADKQPVYGEEARKQSRLHPRESLNQFWAQLSLDPLSIKNRYFRHTADAAHGHLRQLTAGIDLTQDTVIAVPSHFSRNQLAVLLGIVKTCDIPVSGMVDLALLQAVASDSQADTCIIVDLQLHQAVLTGFHRVNGHLQRDRVVQVPASGLLALQDAWTNMITDEFIKQTRFDPKHNAEVEQYLYNELDRWIEQSARADELQIEINHQGRVHQAHITHAAFGQRARNVFERIRRELDQLVTRECSVHILRSQLQLPGLTAGLPGISALDDEQLMEACLANLDHIRKEPDQVHFITKLPAAATGAAQPAGARLPTHLLLRHKALQLPVGRLALGKPEQGDYVRVLPLDGVNDNNALIFHRTRKQLVLELQGLEAVWLNGSRVGSGETLVTGDAVQLDPDTEPLRLIQVE